METCLLFFLLSAKKVIEIITWWIPGICSVKNWQNHCWY